MKKFKIFVALLAILACAFSIFAINEALAAAKSRALVQTDISNAKLREYNAEKTYDTLTNINDSAFNLSTDDLADISPGQIGGVTPAAGAFTTLSASSTLGVTGTSTLGAITTTGILTVDSVVVNKKSLSLPGRATISICGDLTTINNNTVYYGPSAVLLTQSGQTCDTTATGNTTEATADEPGFVGTAFQILSMDCRAIAPGATVSFTTRSAAAATTPSMTCSMTTAQTDCNTNAGTTTAIASGATIAIAAASTGDIGATKGFRCNLWVAY